MLAIFLIKIIFWLIKKWYKMMWPDPDWTFIIIMLYGMFFFLVLYKIFCQFYYKLAEGPGVARGKINFEKNLCHPRPPLSVHKKFQPNRSSRLAGYREHIYDCLVILYRYFVQFFLLEAQNIMISHL